MREVKTYQESDHEIVNIYDLSANKIYAFWKYTHTGIHVYHVVMIQIHSLNKDHTRNYFCFIDSAGAMINGMSPGEGDSGLHQSEVDLIYDMMKKGYVVYEFEKDREFREWAGKVEEEETIANKEW